MAFRSLKKMKLLFECMQKNTENLTVNELENF